MSANMGTSIKEFGYKQELKRSLTLRDLLVYGLIFIILRQETLTSKVGEEWRIFGYPSH